MAYITPIGSNPEQVEYRLGQGHGCTGPGANDRQFSYHADGRERPLRWIGRGLAEVDIEAGVELTDDQFDAARALMRGEDPRTGERLVEAKLAVPDDAKVSLSMLVRAVHGVAQEAGVPVAEVLDNREKLIERFAAAERAVDRKGEAARMRADEAGELADIAGVDVADVWAGGVFERAAANLWETRTERQADGTVTEVRKPRRVVVGNAGYDATATLPKSYATVLAFAEPALAADVERLYMTQVERAFGWLETLTAYGMRGQHGRGKAAETVQGSGFLGWTMVHRAARPADDRDVGDPHWHVHISFANMTKGSDDKWSTVAAGGRDLMRHVAAYDHMLKALVRHQLNSRYGIRYYRNKRTGAWEIAGLPDATLRQYSKRHSEIKEMLTKLGYDPDAATRAQDRIAEQRSRGKKGEATAAPDATLQDIWQGEELAAGRDPAEHMRKVFNGGTDPDAEPAPPGTPPGPRPTDAGNEQDDEPAPTTPVDAATIAAALLDPETGLTAHSRRFTRADALWRVADAMPYGAESPEVIEAMTDAVLRHMGFVELPEYDRTVVGPAGEKHRIAAGHMRNAQTWTTQDVVDAEMVILRTARASNPEQSDVRVIDPTMIELAVNTAEAQQGYPLGDEQRAALMRLVTVGRMVDTVNGAPGTGKTTLMRAVRVVFEAAGYVVAGAATAAVAAQNLEAESGIDSRTVAVIIAAIDRGDPNVLRGVDVLVLDEANLTEDRDRSALYLRAAATGTRIVEIGDGKQLRGVGVGSLFARVHEIVEGAELVDNRRQAQEDEREAIAAWRDGRYAEALSIWAGKAQLVATETSHEATTAMLARWWDQRQGAPDAHTEMRGLVMLASTNDQVRRLNQAAQALRMTESQLGNGHTYNVAGGERLRLHVGDHVMLRTNDRANQLVRGAPVLNGYRAVVTAIDEHGSLTVEWQQATPDGTETRTAILSTKYVAVGGVELGYAMTVHKSEGLTVGDQWTDPVAGDQSGATVLFHAAGSDNPAMHVATSRHKGQVFIFAGRQELEGDQETYLLGVPRTHAELVERITAKLAEHARNTEEHGDDRPVVVDLGIEEFLSEGGRDRQEQAARTAERAEADRLRQERREQAARERGERRAERERERAERAEADQERRDRAAALVREVWRSEPSLVELLIAAGAFSAVARNLADAQEAGYDPREVLAEVPLSTLLSPTIRDKAAFTAWAIDDAVEKMRTGAPTAADRGQQRHEEQQLRDEAADVLRGAWTRRPELAERVIETGAFDAVIRGMAHYADAGLDVSQLLGSINLAKVTGADNAGAFTAYALRRVGDRQLDQIDAARQRAEDQARRAERHETLTGLARDVWSEHGHAAEHIVGGPSFRWLLDDLDRASQAGYDVRAALADIDVERLTASDIRSPSGAAVFAVRRALAAQPDPTVTAPARAEPTPDMTDPALAAELPEVDQAAPEPVAAHPLAEIPDAVPDEAELVHDEPALDTAERRPHWSTRQFGELADAALRQLVAADQRRAQRLAADRVGAADRAARLREQVEADHGPAVTALDANLARTRELAETVRHAEDIETQWTSTIARVSQAAGERAGAADELSRLGRFAAARREELRRQIDALTAAEQEAEREAAGLAGRAAVLQQQAGRPGDERRHLRAGINATEKEYEHARQSAQRRDRAALDAAQRRVARAVEQEQGLDERATALQAEQQHREQLPEQVRETEEAERAAEMQPARVAAGYLDVGGPEPTAVEAGLDPQIEHVHEQPTPPERGDPER